jgi:hypothetical protein
VAGHLPDPRPSSERRAGIGRCPKGIEDRKDHWGLAATKVPAATTKVALSATQVQVSSTNLLSAASQKPQAPTALVPAVSVSMGGVRRECALW